MKKITEELLSWYYQNKRDLPWRKTKNPYYIWISEIMLQQTRVEAVIGYYKKFIKSLPTLKDLATVSEDELLKLWEGLGYYSRVRNMQKTAKFLFNRGMNNFPSIKEELLSLPGIGNYTAGAILSIAFDKPSVAIDGNVYRILGRLYMVEDSISKNSTYSIYASLLEKLLPKHYAGDFIQSFMDLGSLVCTPKNPKCEVCPIEKYCKAKEKNVIQNYPVRDKKKGQRIEEVNVYLYVYKDKVAIQKRGDVGLLASLYEFPNDTQTISLQTIENTLKQQHISFQTVSYIGDSKHVFSHIIWHMHGYFILLDKPIPSFIWATKKDLQDKYSLPSAFLYYLNYFNQNF